MNLRRSSVLFLIAFVLIIAIVSYLTFFNQSINTNNLLLIDNETKTFYLYDAKPNISFKINSTSKVEYQILDSSGDLVDVQVDYDNNESILNAPNGGYVSGETYTIILPNDSTFNDDKLVNVRILKFNIVSKEIRSATYVEGIRELESKSVLEVKNSELILKKNSSVQTGDVILIKDPISPEDIYAYKVVSVNYGKSFDTFQVITPKLDEVYKDVQIHTKINLSKSNIEISEDEVIDFVKESGMFDFLFNDVNATVDKSEWKVEVKFIKEGVQVKVSYIPLNRNEKFNTNSYSVIFNIMPTAYLNVRGLDDIEIILSNDIDMHFGFSPKIEKKNTDRNYLSSIGKNGLSSQDVKNIVSDSKQASKTISYVGKKFIKFKVPLYGTINYFTESGIFASFDEAIDIDGGINLKVRSTTYIQSKNFELSGKVENSLVNEESAFMFAGALTFEFGLSISGGIEFVPGNVIGIDGSLARYYEMRGLYKTDNILEPKLFDGYFFEYEEGNKVNFKAFIHLDFIKKYSYELLLLELRYPNYEFSTAFQLVSVNIPSNLKVENNELKVQDFTVSYINLFTDESETLELSAEKINIYIGDKLLDKKDRSFVTDDFDEDKYSIKLEWYYKGIPYSHTHNVDIAALETYKNLNRGVLDVGQEHTIGLREDGSVVAVGLDYDGSLNVTSWKDIVAVSAGDFHSIGLKSDGTVVAVGLNYYGQLNLSDWKDIIAVSGGGSHTLGLKSDGTVVAVGANYDGQINVSDWENIVAVSGGVQHSVGLKADGTVVAVGANYYGQTNVSDWENVVAISAGYDTTYGLRSDGTVVAVGANHDDQINVSDWEDIVYIYAGYSKILGIMEDGTMVEQGLNSEWIQGDMSVWKNVIVISSKLNHIVGLRSDGTVVAAGLNYNDQINVSDWSLKVYK